MKTNPGSNRNLPSAETFWPENKGRKLNAKLPVTDGNCLNVNVHMNITETM